MQYGNDANKGTDPIVNIWKTFRRPILSDIPEVQFQRNSHILLYKCTILETLTLTNNALSKYYLPAHPIRPPRFPEAIAIK